MTTSRTFVTRVLPCVCASTLLSFEMVAQSESSSRTAEMPIMSNVLQRVFLVVNGKNGGTAFVIDVGNQQFLITAKHVVREALESKVPVQILHDGKLKAVSGETF